MKSLSTRWASHPLRTSAKDFLTEVRHGLPVSLIATPRKQFACERDSEWQKILQRPELADFDQIPLTCDRGHKIQAIFSRHRGRLDLQEEMFLAADAPLLAYLEIADFSRALALLMASNGNATSMSFLWDLTVIQRVCEWLDKTPEFGLAHSPNLRGAIFLADEVRWLRMVPCGSNSCSVPNEELNWGAAIGYILVQPRNDGLGGTHQWRDF